MSLSVMSVSDKIKNWSTKSVQLEKIFRLPHRKIWNKKNHAASRPSFRRSRLAMVKNRLVDGKLTNLLSPM
jgi:hypothetical protein